MLGKDHRRRVVVAAPSGRNFGFRGTTEWARHLRRGIQTIFVRSGRGWVCQMCSFFLFARTKHLGNSDTGRSLKTLLLRQGNLARNFIESPLEFAMKLACSYGDGIRFFTICFFFTKTQVVLGSAGL